VIVVEERARFVKLIVVGILMAASAAMFAAADPLGTDTAIVIDSWRGVSALTPKSAPAEAGNVSELLINGTSITKTWQGYFGNVTGRITLDDANNWTMYNWINANPEGEIYASNASTISWANVNCFNLTGANNGKVTNRSGNLTEYELYLGVPATAVDGINETFDAKSHSAFGIGTRTINSNTCWSIKTYVNDTPQTSSSDFIEVIMYDNSTKVAVFATLINNTVTGFNERKWDFQLMAPVQGGHGLPPTLDTFYFYVELE
jgi:hypothetical protein